MSANRWRGDRVKLAKSRLVLYATVGATRFFGRYSSRLAGAITYWLWFTPWRVPISDRGVRKQTRWLEATQPFTLDTSKGRVAGFAAGDGPVVMLVHGWGERAAGLGGFIAPLTDAGFRVVGFDLPAHGASSRQMTNPIEWTAVMREVAEHFGGAHAVVAHSLGANAALLAMKEGLNVGRAVLIAPNVDLEYALETFQAMFGLPPKAIEGFTRKLERNFGHNIRYQLRGDLLATNLTTPGVVFHDPDDPQVPFAGSERLVRAWKNSTLIEVPGLGHGNITRDPSVIERAVAFIAEPVAQPALEPATSGSA